MPVMSRMVLFVYNLIMLALAGCVIALSLGWSQPLTYLTGATASLENRMILGAVGIILGIIALFMLFWGLMPAKRTDSVVVSTGAAGEVSLSVAAVKAIIMKAVKQVDGIKELRPEVGSSTQGVTVKLHTMISPDQSVPDTAQSLQKVVADNLEELGGLKVAQIRVLVDDFSAAGK